MEDIFKLRKGLDIKLEGVAVKEIKKVADIQDYAMCPDDFIGIVPKVMVKPGDVVKAGSVLFVNKRCPSVQFVSPVSGIIEAVERGERRKVLSVRIKADKEQDFIDFGKQNLESLSGDSVKELLLTSGLFGFIKQRPFDVTACPDDTPKAIFVSSFSKMPLAADFSFVVKGQEEDFHLGIVALSKMAKVHIGITPAQQQQGFVNVTNADVHVFDGPNPSGNVGVHINHVDPINKGEIIWTLGAEEVLFIGRLIRTGKVDFTRIVALAGSEVKDPAYYQMKVGAALEGLLKSNITESSHVRVINGNPLVGTKTSCCGFLGAHVTEVTVIPEGDDVHEVFGWIAPRLNDFSVNRSYFSWLLGKKAYRLDARIKGGERHMIMSGEYDRVFPMDIYPEYLIKAIITGDIDRMEALGIYEVAPEDFAVAEFVDSSKLELQRIVRQGLDMLRKELM